MKIEMLLCQGSDVVAIPSNGIPVITFGSGDSIGKTAMAVNFLRSGCPAVQMVHGSNIKQDWDRDVNKVCELLGRWEINEEFFALNANHQALTMMVQRKKREKQSS